MRKNIFRLAAILLLTLSILCVPAFAAAEYGVVYDETGALGSETLTYLGENTLPMFSEQLGIDMRVDVLTLMSSETVEKAASTIYRNYDYGFGEDMSGVTLTILMKSQGDTYAMVPDTWCIYVGGSDESLTDGSLRDAVTAAVEPYMAERAWNGDDITMSAVALTQAIEAMISSTTDYILGGADTVESAEPAVPDDPPEPAEAEPDEYLAMEHVLDMAGLLSYDEWKTLEKQAAAVSAQYGCGVYAVTVDDYVNYGPDIETVAESVYHELELGEGSGSDGLLLILSMADRDYAVFAYGDAAEYAFNSYGLEQLEGCFLDNFAENDWSGGFSDYLDECGRYLALAQSGKPVRAEPWGTVAVIVIISVLIALTVCMSLKRKMKSVRQKTEANEYVSSGGLKLTERQDIYTHTTETRTKIESKSSGSSSSFSGSGGGSGRSGKF